MSDSASHPRKNLPGKGLLGWLGRQVGHVKKALRTDVAASKTLYRDSRTEEHPLPDDPKIKLRRTIIDEVIEEKRKQD